MKKILLGLFFSSFVWAGQPPYSVAVKADFGIGSTIIAQAVGNVSCPQANCVFSTSSNLCSGNLKVQTLHSIMSSQCFGYQTKTGPDGRVFINIEGLGYFQPENGTLIPAKLSASFVRGSVGGFGSFVITNYPNGGILQAVGSSGFLTGIPGNLKAIKGTFVVNGPDAPAVSPSGLPSTVPSPSPVASQIPIPNVSASPGL